MKNKLFTLFVILFVCVNLFATEQYQSSFSVSLKEGLKKIGVTNSFNEISVLMGTAFVPAIVPDTTCFFSGVQKADGILLDNLSNDSGIKCERLEINSKVWSRAVIRQYFRRLIVESFLKTNLALIQGGWNFQSSDYDWGIVEKIEKDGTISGKVNEKSSQLISTPKQLLVISFSEDFDFCREKDKILASAIKLLNNINEEENLLTGVGTLEYFGNISYRQPFCLKCNKSSDVCVKNFLKKYSENLSQGINYLKSLKNQNENLTNAINEFSIILKKLNELNINFNNLELQSKLGEKIRSLNSNQGRAAAYLTLYIGKPGPIPEPIPEFYFGNEKKILVKYLPLFKDIKDGQNTFLCSTLMAGQVGGIERNLDLLKFCSGIPFKFLINRKTFMPPKDIFGGIDSSEKLFDSINYGFVKYLCPSESRNTVKNYVKQKIKKSIDRGYPVVISSTNGWGVLAGYSGNNFLCRFPNDSKEEFTYIRKIPREVFAFGKRKKEKDVLEQIKIALQEIIKLNELTNSDGFVSGISALQYWINTCNYYSEKKIQPSKKFAIANYKLWTKLLEDKRDSYNSIHFVIQYFPELSIPFSFVKKNYLEEINILKCGLADKIVLNFKDGSYTKPNWLPENAKKQIAVLKKIKKLEKENLLHYKISLRQLEMNARRPLRK
ncbi:MAG: hypothetical protein ACTSXL_03375 [Alphaproteobacteria bacterium]